MTPPIRLVPVPPTPGGSVTVDRSPFWIGSGNNAALQVALSGVAERHASLTVHPDGLYLSPFPGASPPRISGRPISQSTRLRDRDRIEIGPVAKWDVAIGEPRSEPAPVSPAPSTPAQAPRAAPRTPPRPAAASSGGRFPGWAIALLGVLVAVAVGGGYLGYRAWSKGRQAAGQTTDSFTYRETQLYDSLMAESSRSIERGSTLLELGLRDAAREEFALALAGFEKSLLADNRFVRPTIEALAATVYDIYRFNRIDAPAAFARGSGRRMDLSRNLPARLTMEQFRVAVDQVRLGFRRRYTRDVEITGADHPEHLSLYGPGGALDIRVRNLTRAQTGFLIAGFGAVGVRVKDFSDDVILQRQVRAAMAAGLAVRAGTGLHLHIDRFRDRRDRYTVPGR